MRRAVFVLVLLVTGLGSISPAGAADKSGLFEVSPFLGAYFFDRDLDSTTGAALGARGGYYLTNAWEAEA
ncbi:MAG TPA: hypothetical protein VIU40_02425, partial [Geobacteraceae bacterium]